MSTLLVGQEAQPRPRPQPQPQPQPQPHPQGAGRPLAVAAGQEAAALARAQRICVQRQLPRARRAPAPRVRLFPVGPSCTVYADGLRGGRRAQQAQQEPCAEQGGQQGREQGQAVTALRGRAVCVKPACSGTPPTGVCRSVAGSLMGLVCNSLLEPGHAMPQPYRQDTASPHGLAYTGTLSTGTPAPSRQARRRRRAGGAAAARAHISPQSSKAQHCTQLGVHTAADPQRGPAGACMHPAPVRPLLPQS